ncbi:ribonucleoside-diphosphate reductase class II [Tenacibaculum adriaticum]|uniref:Vitamin B12-dependent ribonucleotide reductase n=1 Tax=Tenacibaculum adriaticum TaxID=413713 RepID=A0A5S5DUI5_9FLAO|nr:adenosylcobalamin-dependent ribonucleoside-diphosphate reductase [Tenacibaculum adriaticum]TYP98998.1 ribonucleoside-diphosphate reductase class II [Tenacibaculum adriaticum]
MSVKLTENAIQILEDRYLLKDNEGSLVETAEELFKRVATFVASAEKKDQKIWEARFYKLMSTLVFLPNSPTLMNAGVTNGQLSACFVLPVEDRLEAIFSTLKDAALIHQSGGGTGFNFSKLRPKDDIISSSGGTSSGPIAFMKIYDAATENVKQGGKRRGANMGILNINHPDIEAFINSKSDKKELQNFNLSVGITDDFMEAVKHNLNWELINPRTLKIEKIVKAKLLWDSIVKEAWKTGDPGLIFLDTINKSNPTPKLGKIESTNPCGEVPLLPYESCNLGSINLSFMLSKNGDDLEIDWNKLAATIELAIRFLDNIITVNHYLLPKIKSIAQANRKIGLGVMGWAEMLIQLKIPYASQKAVHLGENVMQFIKEKSYEASRNLAKEKGVFPSWENSIQNKILLRNATCNSIAPTGSISVIANTSYSIEPLFALAYKRTGILGGKNQIEVNKLFKAKMKELGFWNETFKRNVLKTGSIKEMKSIPETIRNCFETSLEIPWKYHLLHQKAFQKYTDNAVSKTVNLPEGTSAKDISEIYWTAWNYKLKGITVYRDGCREDQVLQKCNFNTIENCDI